MDFTVAFLSPLDVVAVLPLNEHILGLLLHLVVANTHPQRLARRVYTDMNYILAQRSQFIYCLSSFQIADFIFRASSPGGATAESRPPYSLIPHGIPRATVRRKQLTTPAITITIHGQSASEPRRAIRRGSLVLVVPKATPG